MAKSILLLANFRTGSSDYSHKLAIDNNMKWLPEPHYFPGHVQLLEQHMDESLLFVTKFMPDHIDMHQCYRNMVYGDYYKIKLTREDKVEQIVSHYICLITNIWNSQDKYARGEKYFVPLVDEQIHNAIKIILRNDAALDALAIKFDEEITYEQLLSAGKLGSRMEKIIPPTNINSIRRKVKEVYANYR